MFLHWITFPCVYQVSNPGLNEASTSLFVWSGRTKLKYFFSNVDLEREVLPVHEPVHVITYHTYTGLVQHFEQNRAAFIDSVSGAEVQWPPAKWFLVVSDCGRPERPAGIYSRVSSVFVGIAICTPAPILIVTFALNFHIMI